MLGRRPEPWRPTSHALRPSSSFAWILILSGCALLAVGTGPLSRRFVFPTFRVPTVAPPADLHTWTLPAKDGVAVHALSLDGPPGAPVFVYFHNNRETMVDGVTLARALGRSGFGVVLPEYRGYGLSGGTAPSEQGLYLDAEAVLDRLAEEHVGPDRIVLWGASLGTGVAAEMARRGRGSALVLVSPYTSIPDVVTSVVPLLPARWLMPDTFDTLTKAPSIRVPTLVVHGDTDEIIPFWMGRKIADAISKAQLVIVRGGHHGDLFSRDGTRLLRAMIALGRGTAS